MIDHESLDLPKDERGRIRIRAAENARSLGISEAEWQKRRKAEGTIIADILMAVDPRPAPMPPEIWADRPLLQRDFAALVGELMAARRERDAGRLRTLLAELMCRRSRFARRMAARCRVALLAVSEPHRLPFGMQ